MIHLKKFSVCTVLGTPNENIVQNHLNIALFVKRILVFNKGTLFWYREIGWKNFSIVIG